MEVDRGGQSLQIAVKGLHARMNEVKVKMWLEAVCYVKMDYIL